MKTRTVCSGVIAAGLTLAFIPLGCGGAQEDYEVVSRPPEQASTPAVQDGQFPEATARELRTCVERGAARLPKSSAVRFDVEPNDAGKVVKIELRNTTIRDADVEECLRGAIANMTVPERALRNRSSRPVSGGERMMREQRAPLGSESGSENPLVLVLILDMIEADVIIKVGVGVIAAVGTLVMPRKKGPKDECADKYSDCMDTPLGNIVVDVYGTSLCETCRRLCVNDEAWPSAVKVTQRWHSCRY